MLTEGSCAYARFVVHIFIVAMVFLNNDNNKFVLQKSALLGSVKIMRHVLQFLGPLLVPKLTLFPPPTPWQKKKSDLATQD